MWLAINTPSQDASQFLLVIGRFGATVGEEKESWTYKERMARWSLADKALVKISARLVEPGDHITSKCR